MKTRLVVRTLATAFGIAGAASSTLQAASFLLVLDSTGPFVAADLPPPLGGPNPVHVTITHSTVVQAPGSPSPFDFSGLLATQEVDFSPTMAAPPGPPLINNGAFTFTSVGGDLLKGAYSGFLYPPDPADPSFYLAPCTFTFSGGTGLFSAATGGGSMLAEIQFTDAQMMGGVSEIYWEAKLNAIPEPTVTAGVTGLGLLAFLAWRQWNRTLVTR